MSNRLKHLLASASLTLIAIVAYWQVAFNKYILTHDFINCWMPWRYYLSNCIQNGIFPYWNPYQQLGYPIHADLQGPIWYLESWLFSFFTQQNPVNLQYLFVGYIALAGIGMYGLSYYLQGSKKVAWIIGVAYMLGGFFVAHSQHFYSIISAAWLPFIVLNFLRLVQLRQFKYGIYMSIFLFFTLTGGNHTFAFFTAYLLILLSIYYLYESFKISFQNFTQLLSDLLITMILTLAQVIMIFVSFVQVQPFISRLNGLDMSSSATNPFTFKSFISFFQPFATTVEWEYYLTDPSMSNHYFGILLLPFLFLFLWKKKSKLEIIIALFALFCLVMSFGEATPIYNFMYAYLPGVNLFRFVSYFAFMFTFCMLLLIGNSITFFQVHFQQKKKLILIGFISLLSVLLFMILYAVLKGNLPVFLSQFFKANLFERNSAGSRFDHIAFQGIIQMLLVLGLLVFIWKKSNLNSYAFMMLIGIDLVLAVQLNIGNVCVGNTSPVELNNYLKTLPKDFPCPADEPLANYNEERGQKHGLYRNTALFHKWVSDSYHNSFVFTGKTYLYFEKTKFYQALLQNRLFYLSNSIYPWSQLDHKLNDENLNSKVFMDQNSIDVLTPKIIISDVPVEGKVELKKVNPNILEASLTCNAPSMLHCIQSFYPGWKAYVDNQETKIYKSNGLTMSIFVPMGTHQITLKYRNYLALFSGIVAYTVFILLFVYISFINRNHTFYRYLFAMFWIIGILALLKYFCF